MIKCWKLFLDDLKVWERSVIKILAWLYFISRWSLREWNFTFNVRELRFVYFGQDGFFVRPDLVGAEIGFELKENFLNVAGEGVPWVFTLFVRIINSVDGIVDSLHVVFGSLICGTLAISQIFFHEVNGVVEILSFKEISVGLPVLSGHGADLDKVGSSF